MSHVKYGYLLLRALVITTLFGNVSAKAASPEERDSWIAANVVGTPEAYQNFLENHPTSEFADKAFSAIADKIKAKPPKPVVPATPPAVTPAGKTASSGAGAGSGGGIY